MSNRHRRNGPFIIFAVVVAFAIAVIGLFRWSTTDAPANKRILLLAPGSLPPVANGSVTDDGGHPIPRSVVFLVIVNTDGKEISRHQVPVSADGTFQIGMSSLPSLANLSAGLLIAQADSYLARKANVTIRTNADGTIEIRPQHICLILQPYNSALVFVLLLPAIFGINIALLHLTGYGESLGVSKLYAVGTALLWSIIVLWLLWLYATERTRAALIPLFWEDLFISSGVIVFAFVGTMVYVAYSMHEKDARFAEWSQKKKRQVLLTLGGRVLVGPYVAVVAYGVLAATFPPLNTGAAAAFFGFFTGLWIKPVLEALNDIGLRLLSAESRKKVADRFAGQDFDGFSKETSSADFIRAERAFLQAVAAAREQLLQRNNVIGVGAGEKVVQGLATGRRAVVVYVYSKRELPDGDPSRVPPSVDGFPTDVQVVPPPPADDRCHSTMLDISPEKIYADQRARGLAASVTIGTDAAVPYLVDPSMTLFFGPEDSEGKAFVIRSAYEAVRTKISDKFDFVAFVLDRGMSEGYYFRPIFNDVSGIDFYWERDSAKRFDKRAEWNVRNLRGVLVFPQRLNVKTCLHELGHAWSSYIRFHAPTTLQPLLDGNLQHWSLDVDSESSCMVDSFKVWRPRADGTFVEDDMTEFVYSSLDLYLMGLLPIEHVSDVRFLERTPMTQPPSARISETVPASPIGKLFRRDPPPVSPKPKPFRLALVAVAATEANGRALAEKIEDFRLGFEASFAQACLFPRGPSSSGRVLATLSTSLT